MALRQHDWMRIARAGTVTAVVLTFAVTTKRVGEGDRSESRAIGTMRAITSAQDAYRNVTGHYESLECLASARCAPGLGHPFLGGLRSPEWSGYRIEFHPGAPAASAPRPISQSAMTGFAAVAVPISAARQQHRAFCVDASGVIQVTAPGGAPRVEAARCRNGVPLR
jgi:hypothetical protein